MTSPRSSCLWGSEKEVQEAPVFTGAFIVTTQFIKDKKNNYDLGENSENLIVKKIGVLFL